MVKVERSSAQSNTIRGTGAFLPIENAIAILRQAGQIVAETLQALGQHVKPGVTTAELDALAQSIITKRGAKPSFKGYHGFPGSICASVNSQVVHGIPSKKVVLKEGDIISLDVGATLKGYVGDAALTLPVGQVAAIILKIFLAPCKITPNRADTPSCGNTSDTALAGRCTKSRRFQIIAKANADRNLNLA